MNKRSSKTDKRLATKQKICKYAVNMFYKNGTKSVKMDDISAKLKISKRTLYEIFEDKEQLLLECMIYKVEAEHNDLANFVHNEAQNVMQIIIKFYEIRMEIIKKISPVFYSDLERYPKVRRYLKEHSISERNRSVQFFKRGVEDGYFIPELNYDIVTRIGEAYMDYIMQKRLYDEYPMNEIFLNFISVIVRGFCTEEGKEMLKKFLEEHKA